MINSTNRSAVAAFISILVFYTSASYSALYNAANDFSLSNPNGQWSYGYSTSLGSAFTPYALTSTSMGGIAGIDVQYFPISLGQPSVFKNTTGSTVFPFGTITLDPGQLALHPGPNGEYSIVRWTAPEISTIELSGSYIGIGGPNTSTDVHVLYNGISIFDGLINSNSTSIFSDSFQINSGDTIDFMVGSGGNGYGYDSTALDVEINTSAVPLPAAFWLFGTGLFGLTWVARRKKT